MISFDHNNLHKIWNIFVYDVQCFDHFPNFHILYQSVSTMVDGAIGHSVQVPRLSGCPKMDVSRRSVGLLERTSYLKNVFSMEYFSIACKQLLFDCLLPKAQ